MPGPVRDFKSTEDGEWAVVNGDFVNVAGEEAVPQGIRIRLGMFLGECYLNEDLGVDYFTIMSKGVDSLLVRSLLQRPIADTPDVVNVVGAELVRESGTRDAAIAYQCDTVYSDVTLAGQQKVP